MPSLPGRALLGFVAAVLSVLTFHQGVVELYHLVGMAPAAWSMRPVPPFNVPRLIDLCFWGGMYGLLLAALAPKFRLPMWLCGVLLGIVAAMVGWFVVAPLKGLPLAGHWDIAVLIRSIVINGSWGLGVGLILPLLVPTLPRRRRRFAH